MRFAVGWRHGVGVVGQQGQAGQPQFGPQEMAKRGEDLVGLAGTLDGLGESRRRLTVAVR